MRVRENVRDHVASHEKWYAPNSVTADPWYVYVLECTDGSLYTGIALDVDRRVEEHNAGKGAKYTRGRGPVRLLGSSGPLEHGDALRREMEIKKLRGDAKLTALG